ncbi:MAG: hypothetical protein GY799_26900, partial [Desulfobulbaceae bacterium]|nr:hypothetical protein [Desulfobulbaceae bacterium]
MGEPNHAGKRGGKSVWWTWTAPETEYLSFDTHGSNFSTLLAVYTGSSVDNLTEIASNDYDGIYILNSGLIFQAQSLTRYYIAVDTEYGSAGDIVLNWRKAMRPANDDFDDAITLEGISGQTSGSNKDATKETGEPDHAGISRCKSVWWTWTAPETEYFSFDTNGGIFILAVYTGSDVETLTEVASTYSNVIFKAQSGVRYYIAVDGYSGKYGDIVLNWKTTIPAAGDFFADAITLEGVSGQTTGSNADATKETGEPDHTGNIGGKSIWWTWTAPGTDYFYFDTSGNSFDILLAVYSGSGADSLTEVAGNYNVGSGNRNSGLTFHAQSGVRYYIAVDGKRDWWSTDSGDIVLDWGIANDNFADAISITGLSGQTTGSNTYATKETDEPNHAGGRVGKSVWWTWTAPENDYFYFDTHGSSFYTLLAVYTGSSVDNLTEIACIDDDVSGLIFQAQSLTRYYIAVDTRYNFTGTIVLNWRKAVYPANDDFADAITLDGLSGQTNGSNVGDMDATKETGEPNHAGYTGGKSLWWTWTAPETDYFYFDTHGSNFDTLLAVYTGLSIDSLTNVANNDDDGSDNRNSSLIFQAQSGVQYYIAVDGFDIYSGDIFLNWRKAVHPANDDFAGAITLAGLSGQTTGSITDATKETGEPSHAAYGNWKTVWWTWTAPETDYFYFDTHESSFDTLLAVYTGSDIYSLAELASNNNDGSDSSLIFQAQSGVQYYIAVGRMQGYSEYPGDIVLNWRKAVRPSNDDFDDAIILEGISGQTTGSNKDASKETGEPDHAGINRCKSVWWAWTAPETEYFSFDTYGSTFNTLLAVYTGSDVRELTEIASNDDDGIYAPQSGLNFRAESGTMYYIATDGYSGDIILSWRKLTSAGLQPDSVSRTLGIVGENLEITLTGNGFDRHTRISVQMDIGNKNKIIGSWSGDVASPRAVTVIGDTAYVADGPGGLKVIDVSNPESPVKIGAVDTPGNALDVAVIGDTAYVACGGYDEWSGLQIINVSSPESPLIIGSVDTWGYANSVAVIEDMAYVADSPGGLKVIDVSNPESPVIIGDAYTPGSAYDIAVIGDTAYVADGPEGLQVIDVSNPESPVITGVADTPDYAYGVAVIGDTAYVTDESEGLQVIDVSNPESPVIIGTADTPGSAVAVAVIGDTAYVADWAEGLQVIDVSNPESPVKVGVTSFPGYAWGVAVFDDTAYMACEYGGLQMIDVSNPERAMRIGTGVTPDDAEGIAVIGDMVYMANGPGGLLVIDASNPENPMKIGLVDTPGVADSVAVVGNTAYVADEEEGLQVIDVSNPENPVIIGSVDTPGDAEDVTVVGNTAYVADSGKGLQVIDVSNPENPLIIGTADTPGVALGVAVVGNTAYVADGSEGLQVIDVSSPENPLIIGTAGSALSVAVIGDTAYVANGWEGLQVIDVSSPENPLIIGYVDTPGGACSIVVIGDIAYVADRWEGLQVIDVSSPENPVIIETVDTPGKAYGVAVIGDAAYVADSGEGLQVIDVSSPESPPIIRTADTPGVAEGVAVVGNTAYVADEEEGLQMIDVSNPASPVIIGTADTPSNALDVAVIGDTAYVVCGYWGEWRGLQVINVNNPKSPVIIGTVDIPGIANGIAVFGNTAYVANEWEGLQIIDVSNPESPVIIGTANTPGGAQGVAVVGNTAYVADGSGLQII